MRYLIFFFALILIGCKSSPTPPKSIPTFEFLFQEAKVPADNAPVLFLLHGLGSNKKDLFNFAKHLNPQLRILSLQGPLQLDVNRYSWYNLNRDQSQFKYSIEDIDKVAGDVIQFIESKAEELSGPDAKIFVGGFSQGGILSTVLACKYPDIIDGALCLSGLLPIQYENIIVPKSEHKNVNIFISHGRADNVLKFDEAERTLRFLTKLGIRAEFYHYLTGHTITDKNFIDLKSWLDRQV